MTSSIELARIANASRQNVRGNRRWRLSVDTNYKNHVIKSVASPIPNSDHWTATVSITWSETNQEQLRKFDGPVAGSVLLERRNHGEYNLQKTGLMTESAYSCIASGFKFSPSHQTTPRTNRRGSRATVCRSTASVEATARREKPSDHRKNRDV
jgi:hypothetical protein